MANAFQIGMVGGCGCCDDDCGSICVSATTCESLGAPAAGVDIALVSGGGLTGLTNPVYGTGWTKQPRAVVAGDGCGANVSVQWSATSSSGNSGVTNGGTFADAAGVGTVTWSNPGNAAALDGVFATAILAASETSHYLKTTNFGFAVPASASIVGIKFEVWADTDTAVAVDDTVKLVVGGTVSGSSLATSTVPAASYKVYGGPTSLWGLTPTAAQVNASNFGAVISYTNPDVVQGDEVSVDHVRMTVYWTVPAGITGYTLVGPGAGYTTATITITRGAGDTTGTGASVDPLGFAAITTVGTCTTPNYNIVYSLTRTRAGTGYTDGTGYALGVTGGTTTHALTGTFDVVSGSVTNLVITDRGQYTTTTAPTISFPGAGTPSQTALATATLILKGCCFTFTTGTIYAVKGSYGGHQTGCGAIPLKCPGNYAQGISLRPDPGYMCCGSTLFAVDSSMPLYLTDPEGTVTLAYNSVKSSWDGCHTFTGTVWDPTTFANCGTATTRSGTIAISYRVSCSNGAWRLQAGYAALDIVPGGVFHQYGDAACVSPTGVAITAPLSSPCAVGSCLGGLTFANPPPGVVMTTGSADPVSLSLSFTSTNGCPPIASGTIVVTT